MTGEPSPRRRAPTALTSRRVPRVPGAVLAVVLALLVGCAEEQDAISSTDATPSSTASTAEPGAVSASERVVSFESTIVVDATGAVDVTEVITYDFGDSEHHGIERTIPTSYATDTGTASSERPLSNVSASASPGTPDDVTTSESEGETTIRIGNPDRTISGEHTYTVRYRMADVIVHAGSEAMLTFNVTGHEWKVPIDVASALVVAPSVPDAIGCTAGPPDTVVPCESSELQGNGARFGEQDIETGSGLTIALTFGAAL